MPVKPTPEPWPTSDDLTLADRFELILREMLDEASEDGQYTVAEIAQELAAAAYKRGAV